MFIRSTGLSDEVDIPPKILNSPHDELTLKLHRFTTHASSLRIPASQVSALIGLHPFQNLPQLLHDLVYQSHQGTLLLRRDAAALGLSIVDAAHEQEQMLALASAVSKQTEELVRRAMEVSSGKRKLQTVEEVQSIQTELSIEAAMAEKAGKLSRRQLEILVDATRGLVYTGFGACHEEEALDAYERRVGCCVRERNEGRMEWQFERVLLENGETGVSAAPMGGPCPVGSGMFGRREVGVVGDGKIEDKIVSTSTSMEFHDDALDGYDGREGSSSSHSSKTCFFKIVGAVDGIRDEVYMDGPPDTSALMNPVSDPAINRFPHLEQTKTNAATNQTDMQNSSNDNGEFSDDETDQWISKYRESPPDPISGNCPQHIANNAEITNDRANNLTLRPIIVECKHRMHRAQIPPPLYDQIQTCLYCQLYRVNDADLIQVVRRRKRSGKDEDPSNGTVPADSTNQIDITITRLSLDDPLHNHRHHWHVTILPRLASFVDAVYNVRREDGKRYRLLMALARSREEQGGDAAEKDAWEVLWEECPWLVYCDTSFGRRG